MLAGTPPVELRATVKLYRSQVDSMPSPDNCLDRRSRAIANLGADYCVRGSAVTLGANFNWVPSTLTRLAFDEITETST